MAAATSPPDFSISCKTPFGNHIEYNEFHRKYTIHCDQMLGEGGYGEVFKGTNNETGKECAIKVCPETPKSLQEAFFGILVGSSPHTCGTIEFSVYNGNMHIVMELIKGENLYEFMCKRKGFFLANPTIFLKIILMILAGVEYMHSKGVVHRDVKPENIILQFDKDGNVVGCVFVDFGFANDARNMQNTTVGTLLYMSPEVMVTSEPKSSALDIWALGMILYEMLCGTTLVNNSKNQYDFYRKTMQLMGNPLQPPKEMSGITDPIIALIWDVIKSCLVTDQTKRPSAKDLIERLSLEAARLMSVLEPILEPVLEEPVLEEPILEEPVLDPILEELVSEEPVSEADSCKVVASSVQLDLPDLRECHPQSTLKSTLKSTLNSVLTNLFEKLSISGKSGASSNKQ